MLFNSYEFIFFFLPLTWVLWRLSCGFHKVKLALGVLTIASISFYSWWNPPFVLLLLLSITINFIIGNKLKFIAGRRQPKLILFIGIFLNLALIGYYKYFNFFMQNFLSVLGYTWQSHDIFLPLGISFFTFQQISWLIDSYKGLVKPSSYSILQQFAEYALFVSFFPQLIAGPIVHHGQIIPQFRNARTFIINWRNIAIGLSFFSLGLFKKVILADTFSPWVADGFDNTDTLTLFEAWGTALSYTFQIYFDFSGYSDMAIGLGKLFNVDIPINFNSPYQSTSIIDFWRRWHMTLSKFLRDYVYIPLGGNKFGEARRYINLLLTMLIGGLWHGAAWQFVFWGFLHGIYLCINHLWRKLSITLPKAVGWIFTFIPVVFAWVFFRAESFERAFSIIKGMLGVNGVFIPPHYIPNVTLTNFLRDIGVKIDNTLSSWHISGMREIFAIFGALIIVILLNNSSKFIENDSSSTNRRSVFIGFISGLLFFISIWDIISASRAYEFLYFNF